jgi:hypothetical protein
MANEPNERLCNAAGRGDVAEIERQIAAGADPNAFEGMDDWTPLQWAAYSGHVAAITALLAVGARVNGVNSHDTTALMLAADGDHTAAIDALLAAGADVYHAGEDGYTALHYASNKGHLDAARVLLEVRARTDVRNKDGERPIDKVRAPTRLLVRCSHASRSTCCAAASPCAGLQRMGRRQVQRARPACTVGLRRPLVPPPRRRHRLLRGRVGVGSVVGVGRLAVVDA